MKKIIYLLTMMLMLLGVGVISVSADQALTEELKSDSAFMEFVQNLFTVENFDEFNTVAIIRNVIQFPRILGYNDLYPDENCYDTGIDEKHLKEFMKSKFGVSEEEVDQYRIALGEGNSFSYYKDGRFFSGAAGWGDPLVPAGIYSIEKKDDIYSIVLYGSGGMDYASWGTPLSEISKVRYYLCEADYVDGHWRQLSNNSLNASGCDADIMLNIPTVQSKIDVYFELSSDFIISEHDKLTKGTKSVTSRILSLETTDGVNFTAECTLAIFYKMGKAVLDDKKSVSYVNDAKGVTIPVKVSLSKDSEKNEWTVNSYTYVNSNYSYLAEILDTNGEGLALRADSDMNSEKYFNIPTGEKVYLSYVSGSWGMVSYGNRSGWINLTYTMITTPNE